MRDAAGRYPVAGFEKHPLFNRVEDNTIHHLGALNKYVTGVFLGMTDGNIAGRNRTDYMQQRHINLYNDT